ncbi:MAG: FlgD immunoglobulin-like domain containing protein [bacterium]|nr:FlgD immunoglobulin-like domain containing protein [bacterium]
MKSMKRAKTRWGSVLVALLTVFMLAVGAGVAEATISKIVFTTKMQAVATNMISDSITIQVQDKYGKPEAAGAPIVIKLSSNSTGTAEFSTNGTTDGFKNVSSVTIPSGSNSVTFFYRDSAAKLSAKIEADEDPSLGYTAGTHPIVVTSGTYVNRVWDDQYPNAPSYHVQDGVVGATSLQHNVPATWKEKGSPYIVEGGIKVVSGRTLTIEPGVTVVFVPDNKSRLAYQLGIDVKSGATLTAVGTSTKKITFTSKGQSTSLPGRGDWRSISFESGSAGTIRYATLEYGGLYGDDADQQGKTEIGGLDELATGMIVVDSSEPVIDNITLQYSFGYGILVKGVIPDATFTLDKSTSRYNRIDGVRLATSAGSVNVTNSNIYGNWNWGIKNAGDTKQNANATILTVTGCTIYQNGRYDSQQHLHTAPVPDSLLATVYDEKGPLVYEDTEHDAWVRFDHGNDGTVDTVYKWGGFPDEAYPSSQKFENGSGGVDYYKYGMYGGIYSNSVSADGSTPVIRNNYIYDHNWPIELSGFVGADANNDGIGGWTINSNTYNKSTETEGYLTNTHDAVRLNTLISVDTTMDGTVVPYIFDSEDLTVNTGVTLTIRPGQVIKAGDDLSLYVNGTLTTGGAKVVTSSDWLGNTVLFTSYKDDVTDGRDSNANGFSDGSCGNWKGIIAQAGSTVTLTDATVKYADNGVYIKAANATVSVTDSYISRNNTGVYIGKGYEAATISVTQCAIWDNRDYGIEKEDVTNTTLISAIDNWWGISKSGTGYGVDGPYDPSKADGYENGLSGATTGFYDRGDTVTDYVQYWRNATDTAGWVGNGGSGGNALANFNTPPTADIDDNKTQEVKTVYMGQYVMLDGAGSNDPNSDRLWYRWNIISQPSTANSSNGYVLDALAQAAENYSPAEGTSDTYSQNLRFMAPNALGDTGTYTFGLRVYDGINISRLDTIQVTVVDTASINDSGTLYLSDNVPSAAADIRAIQSITTTPGGYADFYVYLDGIAGMANPGTVDATDTRNLFGIAFDIDYTQSSITDVVSVELGDLLDSPTATGVFHPILHWVVDEEAGKVSISVVQEADKSSGGIPMYGVVTGRIFREYPIARVRFKVLSGANPSGTVVSRLSFSNISCVLSDTGAAVAAPTLTKYNESNSPIGNDPSSPNGQILLQQTPCILSIVANADRDNCDEQQKGDYLDITFNTTMASSVGGININSGTLTAANVLTLTQRLNASIPINTDKDGLGTTHTWETTDTLAWRSDTTVLRVTFSGNTSDTIIKVGDYARAANQTTAQSFASSNGDSLAFCVARQITGTFGDYDCRPPKIIEAVAYDGSSSCLLSGNADQNQNTGRGTRGEDKDSGKQDYVLIRFNEPMVDLKEIGTYSPTVTRINIDTALAVFDYTQAAMTRHRWGTVETEWIGNAILKIWIDDASTAVTVGDTIAMNYGSDTSFYTILSDVAGNAGPDTVELQGNFCPTATESLWPGDTDNDGDVDAADVLPIGQYWGTKGAQRYPVKVDWEDQAKLKRVTWWGAVGTTARSATYADADGNGKVEAADVLIVGLNWGKTHTNIDGVYPAPTLAGLTGVDHALHVEGYRAVLDALNAGPQTPVVLEMKALLETAINLGVAATVPFKTFLGQSYPNPLNPAAWIPFALADETNVAIKIYSMSGELVRSLDLGKLAAGTYTNKVRAAYWDGKDSNGNEVASGVYLYQLRAGDVTATRKMVVLK